MEKAASFSWYIYDNSNLFPKIQLFSLETFLNKLTFDPFTQLSTQQDLKCSLLLKTQDTTHYTAQVHVRLP